MDETDCYLFCGWSLLVDVASVALFTLFFIIPTPNFVKLLGFTNDEIPLPIVEVPGPHQLANSVQVYNCFTQSLQNLGIKGVDGSFYIGPYKESLILLPYPDPMVDGVLAKKMCLVNVLDDISLGDVTRVYRPKDIINDLNIDMNIDVLNKRGWKGKQLVVESNQGCPIASFAQLPYYCYNLKLANENTVTRIETDEEGHFKMLFIGFGAALSIYYVL
ncbi:hypothetical protein Tco_1225748 [Tanacetum coccineum]